MKKSEVERSLSAAPLSKEIPVFQVSVRPAETAEAQKEVRAIVAERYVNEGYYREGDSDPSLSPYYDSPEGSLGRRFALYSGDEEEIIGTIGVAFDSGGSLPMDELYKKDLDVLRTRGLTLAEVGQFATRSGVVVGKSALRRILQGVESEARSRGADAIVFMIHPDHDKRYGAFGFKRLGTGVQTVHERLQNAPALARWFPLTDKARAVDQELSGTLDQMADRAA